MPPKGTTRKRTLLQDNEDLESLPLGKKARLDAPDDTPSTTSTPTNAPAKGRRSRVSTGKVSQAAQETEAPEVLGKESTAKKSRRSPRNVYDVPDSGDELAAPIAETPIVEKTATARQSAGRGAASGQGTATKGSTGRKRTSAKKQVEEPTIEATQVQTAPAPPTPSRATPSKIKPKTKSQILRELRQAGTRGLQSLAELEKAAKETPVEALPTQLTPHGRRKFTDKEPSIGLGTPLKSIMTPQKKAGTIGRPRKNVAFNNDENTAPAEVFFDDLPSKSATKPAKPANKQTQALPAAEPAGEEEKEDEDDEVCSVCKKPDSKRGNQILFCDGCDMAVHQKCYNVPTVPKGDWFCRDCLQEDAVVPQTNGAVKPSVTITESEEQVPDIPEFERHLRVMQRVLIDRCTGRRRIPLRGQDEAYEKAFQLVEQTVLAGEGNSMLVIGARGSGKTTLVESIVSKMATDHKEEFHVVRLNGFIHTDDKIALKEIWRQLGKEMEVEDDLINKVRFRIRPDSDS